MPLTASSVEAWWTKPTVSSARSYGDTEEGRRGLKGFQEEGVEEWCRSLPDEGQGWRLASKGGSMSKEMKSRERRFPRRWEKFSRSSVLGRQKKVGAG